MEGLPDDLPEQLRGLDPQQVLAFLRTAGEPEIAARVHELGTARVLALLFAAWADRIDPRAGRAPGRLAFDLDDEGTTHRHVLTLDETGAAPAPDPDGAARATLSTTLVRFLRIAAGAQDPKWLVLSGRLRLSGDVVWAVATLAGLQQR